jgi:hypothetical protein
MSNATFPALPGLQRGWEREEFRKTDVFETPSGIEQVSVRQAAARFRWSLTYRVRQSVMAAAPWQAYTERAALRKIFSDHYARGDSFLFTCPEDGQQYRVRFDDDGLSLRHLAGGLYEADVELVSVL